MAFLELGFTATNMGDSSSETTNYIVEIVDCSNTTVPVTVNGKIFRTTITDAPKNGDIPIIFENVPANTIISASNKLKVTGSKNGKPIISYGDCNSSPIIVCSENQQQTCTISNVQIAQVICS